MIVIKYVRKGVPDTYSLAEECAEPQYGEKYNSARKAIKFVETKFLKEGFLPEGFESVHVCELSGGYLQIRRNFLNKKK